MRGRELDRTRICFQEGDEICSRLMAKTRTLGTLYLSLQQYRRNPPILTGQTVSVCLLLAVSVEALRLVNLSLCLSQTTTSQRAQRRDILIGAARPWDATEYSAAFESLLLGYWGMLITRSNAEALQKESPLPSNGEGEFAEKTRAQRDFVGQIEMKYFGPMSSSPLVATERYDQQNRPIYDFSLFLIISFAAVEEHCSSHFNFTKLKQCHSIME
jgi:hypothetical protein